jgi:small neutral amino acid transporter SnatA (MarC family)
MEYTFVSATILLLLITDPFGNIPIFVNALRNVAPERRMWVILREVLIAFLLLLTFMFVGDGFLRLMNLSELSLQIAGAVILFLIALRMIFPSTQPEAALQGEPLIVPLAIPALTGPSALAQ